MVCVFVDQQWIEKRVLDDVERAEDTAHKKCGLKPDGMKVCGACPAAEIKEGLSVKSEPPYLGAEYKSLERAFRQFPVAEFRCQDGEAYSKEGRSTSGEHFGFNVSSCNGGIVSVKTRQNNSFVDDADAAAVIEMHDNGCKMREKGKCAVVSIPHCRIGDYSRAVYDRRKISHLL